MPQRRSSTSDDRPVAVFDMDGVLIHGDVFGSFVRARLRRTPVNLVATGWALPWLTTPVLLRRTRRRAIKSLLDIALAGMGDDEFAAAAARFGVELGSHPTRVVRAGVEEALGYVDDGHRVVVSTACETRLARAYLDAIGLEDVEVVGTPIRFRRTGPMRVGVHNYGAAKVDNLKAAGFRVPWAVAYSDSLSDVPLLRAAERAVLVNPDDWLRPRAEAALGFVADEVHWPEVRLTAADRRRVG